MNLQKLIKDYDIVKILGNIDIEIEDIIYNSANAKKNTIFVALIGMSVDGHRYIQDAYNKGVRAFVISDNNFIINTENKDIVSNSTFIIVQDTRDTLAYISNVFFNYPSKKLTVIGITGTKGKTTVSSYIKQTLDRAGMPCSVIGTNGVFFADKHIKTVNTTPESYEINKYISKMLEYGIKFLAMEVSSGGIMMKRVNYIDFDYAIFTNLTPDHIGEKEHPTFEHYISCKSKLFSMSKYSIINLDDELSNIMIEKSKKYMTYSIDKKSDLKAYDIVYPNSISDVKTYFKTNSADYIVNSFGKFGVYNALCIIAVCQKIGLSKEQIKTGLLNAHVKGRLQVINIIKDTPIIIDYAHNKVSLENILSTIKALNPNRIITVFGSIGERAKHRRIELAQVSSKYSDIIIVTSDNPDKEDMKSIIDEIISNISKDKLKNTHSYIDRSNAIKKAIELSAKGDIIVLAGKGHEEYQLINGAREHFSDEEEAIKWAKILGKSI